jgi:2-amino-4-hydroxy-6-hydroxymethyldihydropteridine diphosphokinase
MIAENVTVYIGLGSNLGDRAGNLMLAVRGLLEASICIKRLSAIYETEPVGVTEHPSYLNMVAEAGVHNVSPEQIMARMLRVEYLLGRTRDYPKSPRTVDLDLLLFGKERHQTALLTIPHPQMHLRNFVLVPLAEIAPNVVHPVMHKTIREILKTTPDKSIVRRWQPFQNEINDFQLSVV